MESPGGPAFRETPAPARRPARPAARSRKAVSPLLRAFEGGDRGFRDLHVLLAGAGAYADRADHMAVDDYGNAAQEVGELAPSRERELGFDRSVHLPGRHARRRG